MSACVLEWLSVYVFVRLCVRASVCVCGVCVFVRLYVVVRVCDLQFACVSAV